MVSGAESRSDLIELAVDGVAYVAIPRSQAGSVGDCVQRQLSAAAARVGADVPHDLPLWALSLQLAVVAHADADAACGTKVVPDDGDGRLSSHEVAQKLGISPRTVTAAAKRGALRHVRSGTSYRFAWADAETWAPKIRRRTKP